MTCERYASIPGLCYDTSSMAKFLARSNIQRALGIPRAANLKWQECNTGFRRH